MKKPVVLDVEVEFEIMANYQTIIESNCKIVENSPKDTYRFGLYEIAKPYPTYDEYLNGNDFEETELVMESSDVKLLEKTQQIRRNIFSEEPVLA